MPRPSPARTFGSLNVLLVRRVLHYYGSFFPLCWAGLVPAVVNAMTPLAFFSLASARCAASPPCLLPCDSSAVSAPCRAFHRAACLPTRCLLPPPPAVPLHCIHTAVDGTCGLPCRPCYAHHPIRFLLPIALLACNAPSVPNTPQRQPPLTPRHCVAGRFHCACITVACCGTLIRATHFCGVTGSLLRC